METPRGDDDSTKPQTPQNVLPQEPPKRVETKLTTETDQPGGAVVIPTTEFPIPLRTNSPRTSVLDESLTSPTTSPAASPTTTTLSSTPTTPSTSGIPDLQESPLSTSTQASHLPSGLTLEQSDTDEITIPLTTANVAGLGDRGLRDETESLDI